jgi:hypothetical protein
MASASFGALLVILILLGLRSYQVGTLVLPSGTPQTTGAAVAQEADSPLLSVAHMDSILSTTESCDRNPFSAPRGRRRPPPPPRQVDPEPEEGTPSLAALLYDNVEPAVQLKYKTSFSSWLRKGESFRGWVILEISPNSVTILKDGEYVVLE